MPHHKAKLSSRYITAAEMAQFAKGLPQLFSEIPGEEKCMIIHYGWGCNAHQDLLYQPMPVLLEAFPQFLEESIEQKIFDFGDCDLLIDSVNGELKILLCHESDIHIDGSNDELAQKVSEAYPSFEFRTGEAWEQLNAAKNNEENNAG